MLSNKRGSIFLITLTLLTVIFILGFAFTFFTGEEDFSSSMSYESEVAFNLAESAVEEFVARLKNSLNHDDKNNQLYKLLRNTKTDLSKEIPLDAGQVANLTAYTRDLARQIYGIQFGRGLTDSKDFVVTAVLKLQYIPALENKVGNGFKLREDRMEKQGELTVSANVNYNGHKAKVSLTFMIRCVKTFVPPFNYFTLYVRDASVTSSDLNVFTSIPSGQKHSLRLDNGWKFLDPDFNAADERFINSWEEKLAAFGNDSWVPPGRVFLGQDVNAFFASGGAPSVIVKSTNGAKLLYGNNLDSNIMAKRHKYINGGENLFLTLDAYPWVGMKDYVKKYQKAQGQAKTKEGWLFTGWGNDTKIRVLNVGSGKELLEGGEITGGAPSFINCFESYDRYTKNERERGPLELRGIKARMMPDLDLSGFHPFGSAPSLDGASRPDSAADFSKLSPTLVYGPVVRQYFRATQIKTKKGVELELPFLHEEALAQTVFANGKSPDPGDKLTASEAKQLFFKGYVPPEHIEKLAANWDDIPDGLHQYKKYKNFMSDSGIEGYNKGLGNMLQRLRYSSQSDQEEEYKGPLEEYFKGYLETGPSYYYGDKWPSTKFGQMMVQNPFAGYYEGPLSHAMPDGMSTYLYDFYFVPRSTEDFFRGRTTVAIGGVSKDRFTYKYIDDPQSYESGAKDRVLELNGILTLNDNEPLALKRLKFRGHGVIYSSPMMGGGVVVIYGDLLGHDTDLKKFDTQIGNNLLTIVARKIIVLTDHAADDRCYIESNLISTTEPIEFFGSKPVTIKGSVVTPSLNIASLPVPLNPTTPGAGENVIIYNALNGIGRNSPEYLDRLYVAKIVTGGVGKFDWKYER